MSEFCGCVQDVAALSTDADPDVVISAADVHKQANDVRVYFVGNDWFHDRGYSFAYGLGEVGGDDIWINTMYDRDPHIILHELAHTLGYEHGDGGIVGWGYDNCDDMDPTTPLAESTRAVGNVFAGLRLCEWSIRDLGHISSDYSRGVCGMRELQHAAVNYARSGVPDNIYIGGEWARPRGIYYGNPTGERPTV